MEISSNNHQERMKIPLVRGIWRVVVPKEAPFLYQVKLSVQEKTKAI
jgi:hypothetical protein